METAVYEPSEWGKLFHNLPHDEALGAGSAGPGKSVVLFWEPLPQIVVEHERCANPKHPHHQPWGSSTAWVLHIRRTYDMLEETLERAHRWLPQLDPGVKWEAQHHWFRFPSGLIYQFGHCQHSQDWKRYYSKQYTMILYDELTQMEEEQYDQINTRLRSSDPVLSQMLKIRAMSNPVVQRQGENFSLKDPHWVRRRFVDPAPGGKVTFSQPLKLNSGETYNYTWIYLPAKLSDNPDPEFRRTYEINLRKKPPHIRKALLEGDWYITEGSFFGEEWDEDIHVVKPFRIPPDWPQFRCMDWGYKTHGCIYWVALDPDGNMIVHREYTFRLKHPDKVAEQVERIERELGLWDTKRKRSHITGPADTQIWEQKGERGRSKAEEFRSRGVPWVRANKTWNRKSESGSREMNAQRLAKRLADHDDRRTTPGIVFFDTCTMARRTIPGIQTDPDHPEEPLKGGEDHWWEAIAYGCSYADRGPSGIPDGRRNKHDPDDDEFERKRENRGRLGYGIDI